MMRVMEKGIWVMFYVGGGEAVRSESAWCWGCGWEFRFGFERLLLTMGRRVCGRWFIGQKVVGGMLRL